MSLKEIIATFVCDECNKEFVGVLDPSDTGQLMELAEGSIAMNIRDKTNEHLCTPCMKETGELDSIMTEMGYSLE